jgi:putative peptidoglycan lipid II flippase
MSNLNLGRASALLASGTTISRVLGFVKTLVLAQTIGVVGLGPDAFSIANQLPNTVFVIVAGGMLNAVLVPQIVRAASHRDGGKGYINKLVTVALTVLAVATVAATLLAPVLVTLVAGLGSAVGDDNSGQLALATAFAYWCLPQIFFYGLYSVLGEVLNARNSFGPFTWAPVLNNIIAIAALVAFNILFNPAGGAAAAIDFWSPDKIAFLGGTATLGVAVQALILFVFWRRVGLRFRPDFAWRGVGLGQAGRLAGWTFGMLIVTQIAGLVETNVVITASGQDASTTVLTNAWLIFMLPHSIVAVSIATAYFTRMSEHASANDLPKVRHDLSASLRVITMIMVLATVVLIVVAYPFSGFFTRFDFAESTAMGNVLIAFLVGLPPFSMLFVIFRAFYALGDTKTPFFITLFQATVFSVGAIAVLLFVPKEFIGVGVALTLSLAGTLQTAVAAILIRKRLGGVGGRTAVISVLRFCGAAIPSFAVGILLALMFGLGTASGFGSATLLGAVISMVSIGLIMTVSYLGALVVVRSSELRDLVSPILARLRRSS